MELKALPLTVLEVTNKIAGEFKIEVFSKTGVHPKTANKQLSSLRTYWKWLLVNPRLLIVDEPTRGVDVAAKAEVHTILRDMARSGTAVILISSELPEVLAVSDRIYVMREGRIMGELSRNQASEEAILRLASFSRGEHGRNH